MSVQLDPFLDPSARPLQSLGGRASFDTWYRLAVFFPEKLKPKKCEPPLHTCEEGSALDIGIATTNSEGPQYSTKSIIKLVPSLILLFFFARLPVRVAPLLQTSRAAILETLGCIIAGPSMSKGTVAVSRAYDRSTKLQATD